MVVDANICVPSFRERQNKKGSYTAGASSFPKLPPPLGASACEWSRFTAPDELPGGPLASHERLAYRPVMRLKSSIWVAAYLRRCQTAGVFGAVRRRGAEEAGAVFVKVALLDGNAMLYAPAPQTVYDDSRPVERLFAATSPQPVPEASVEERLAKEIRFDPDVWIVETEDRAGRHFLDLAKA